MSVRLRNTVNGGVVVVDDETAGLLGADWVPADQSSSPAGVKPAARKGRPRKSEDE